MKFLDGITPVTVIADNGVLSSIMNGAGEKITVFSFRVKPCQDIEGMITKCQA